MSYTQICGQHSEAAVLTIGRLVLQAAYQAALTQQAAAAQTLLMQQQGGAPFAALQQAQLVGGYSDALAAQVAAQLSLTPGYFNNPNINAAAAAAAAAAVQNLMGEPASPQRYLLCTFECVNRSLRRCRR